MTRHQRRPYIAPGAENIQCSEVWETIQICPPPPGYSAFFKEESGKLITEPVIAILLQRLQAHRWSWTQDGNDFSSYLPAEEFETRVIPGVDQGGWIDEETATNFVSFGMDED